jgi:hypothetical protein
MQWLARRSHRRVDRRRPRVDNDDDVYQHLCERGVEFTEPPKREPWGGWGVSLIPKATCPASRPHQSRL